MQSKVAEFENPDTMPPAMLVSATYDGVTKAAVLKFYEPNSQKLILWRDETNHLPYCYSRLSPEELDFLRDREDILEIKTEKRYDLGQDNEVIMSKIIAADPLAIGGTAGDRSIRNIMETWESDIKYYENYLYDRSLVVGKYYEVKDGKITPHNMEISDEVKLALKSLLWDKVDNEKMVNVQEFREFISEWADLLNQPISKIRRLSVDIEVEAEIGRIPDPKIAEKKVTAIGFKGSDGYDCVFVLKTGAAEGKNKLNPNIKVTFYDEDKEKEMIHDAFKIIADFPFLVTYNGDEFDLPYLYNRAQRLGIENQDNPMYMMRDSATLRHGVHLDLYRTLSNRSFQIYAFSQKYTDFSLNSVSKALIGKEKIDYGIELGELDLYQTANYCYNDALLTYELTSFNNDLLMNLLIIIARIGRMPVDDIARVGVSQWIRSLLYYEHRQRGFLIPKREELQKRSEGVMSDAVIKDKKYRGGLVVEPKEGIHFGVTVMDFASLYPSIIKIRNLSYETVRCPHPECKENKIPQTNHWVCSKKNGLTSIIIGSLRDLRVNYYKSLSRKESLTDQQRQQYTVVSQALKVILNASYGVMGAEIFPLYFLPAAEATTAIGRHTIVETIKKCESAGINVLYGDSVLGDSPVIITDGKMCKIIPIETILPASKGDGRYECAGERVLSDEIMTDIKYAYRHRVKKTGYRVGTKKSYVEITNDHSLMINGKEVKPSDISLGEKIDVFSQTDIFRDDVNVDNSTAWQIGYHIATKVAPSYHTSDVSNTSHSRQNITLSREIELENIMPNTTNQQTTATLIPAMHDNAYLSSQHITQQCSMRGHVIIPDVILNGMINVKKCFLDGLIAGSNACGVYNTMYGVAKSSKNDITSQHTLIHGSDAKKHTTIKASRTQKSAVSGICIILDKLGYDYTLDFQDIHNVILINFGKNIMHKESYSEVTLLEAFEIDEDVYDLSTSSEHFRAGIGNILLHNTDSLFLKNPTELQIQHVIEQAKKDHGVDLEIDKVYRYCVLSNRKKNYLGVTKSGKVDVKGLTGKKSHTPPFIKKLFFELLDVLSEVQNENDFVQAKKQISDKIAACAEKVQSKEIPLEDLTFNVMLSKAPSEYVKTIPQHIRAAKLLENIREVKRGDRISYIKVINKPGVKPLELAKKDEIDSKKYMEFMESTLEQITSSMDLDFDVILGKPKQMGLDDFFWS